MTLWPSLEESFRCMVGSYVPFRCTFDALFTYDKVGTESRSLDLSLISLFSRFRQKLEDLGVTPTNIQATQLKLSVKRQVLELARQWPTYFCMLFPVSVSWCNVFCLL